MKATEAIRTIESTLLKLPAGIDDEMVKHGLEIWVPRLAAPQPSPCTISMRFSQYYITLPS